MRINQFCRANSSGNASFSLVSKAKHVKTGRFLFMHGKRWQMGDIPVHSGKIYSIFRQVEIK